MYCKTLNDLLPGQYAKILKIQNNCNIKQRLLDLGMIKNTIIECVGKSPGGNPCAYLVRGTVIALRNEDCNKIKILIIDGED